MPLDTSAGPPLPRIGPHLKVYLFGDMRLIWGKLRLPRIPGRCERALFAYLITYRRRAHPRALLAGTFWPEMPEARSSRRLSQALWRIRHTLAHIPGAPDYILTEADTVRFNTQAPYWLDVEAFTHRVREAGAFSITSSHLLDHLARFEEAATLYRGDFLAGYYDDWIIMEREPLREMYLSLLWYLLIAHKGVGHYDKALAWARRLVAADPLHEEGQREVMRLCHLLGRSNEAIQQYEQYRDFLWQELHLEPTATTIALYREILAHAQAATAPHLPLSTALPRSPLLEGDGRLPLVGRRQERQALITYLEEALEGRGGVVLLEGEPGVGKSRLLQEVAKDAAWRGMEVIYAKGQEHMESPPYGLLGEALREALPSLRVEQLAHLVNITWLHVIAPLVPELQKHTAHLPPLPALSPVEERTRWLEGLTRVILALAELSPHFWVLDDLQWADSATLDALIYMASRLERTRTLFVLAYRGGEARADEEIWPLIRSLDAMSKHRRIRLTSLDLERTGELIRRSLGLTSKAPRFEQKIYRETEGNPLFVLEVLRYLYDSGLLRRDAAGEWSTPWDDTEAGYESLPLPESIYRLILHRLSAFSSEERDLLDTAAVLGDGFTLTLLSQVAKREGQRLLRPLQHLKERGFLVEERDAYRFGHDKFREVTYREIRPQERKALHRRSGDALARLAPEEVERLAHHYSQAEVWDKAITYARQAGDKAAALFAYERALTHYTHALALLKAHAPATLPPRTFWELHRAREAAAGRVGHRALQQEDLDALHQWANAHGDASDRAWIALRECEYHLVLSEYDEALIWAQRAIEEARAGNVPDVETRAYLEWGRLLRHRGAWEEAERFLTQALEQARRLHVPVQEAEILSEVGALLYDRAHYAEARQVLEQARTLWHALGDPVGEARILNHLGNLEHMLGRCETARAYYERTISLQHDMGNRREEAIGLYNLSLACFDMDDRETALTCCRRALNITRDTRDRRVEGYCLTAQGLILEGLGHWDEAEKSHRLALKAREDAGLPALAVDALAGLTRIAIARGNAEEAIAHAEAILAWFEEQGIEGVGDPLAAYLAVYRALDAAGQGERARSILQTAYDLLVSWAERIPDPDDRRTFMERVDPNRSIVAAHRTLESEEKSPLHHKQQVRLPTFHAPLGRPLQPEEWVEIEWTIAAPEDIYLPQGAKRRRYRLQRLVQEAREQGAMPTLAHLAQALGVSVRTVKRDLAHLRAAGVEIHTRGSREQTTRSDT